MPDGPNKSGKDARFRAPSTRLNHLTLHHHLRHAGCLGKIIFGDQQITLLCDAWRVAEPGAYHVKRELALEFCLSAGSPLLKLYRIEGRGNSVRRSIPRN
jgi:hypothetical protein